MKGKRWQWRTTKTGQQGDGVPMVLWPNWAGLEHQWSEESPTVVAVGLGVARGDVSHGRWSHGARWRRAEGGGVELGARGWVRGGEGLLWFGLIGKRKEGVEELGGGSPEGKERGSGDLRR